MCVCMCMYCSVSKCQQCKQGLGISCNLRCVRSNLDDGAISSSRLAIQIPRDTTMRLKKTCVEDVTYNEW